MKDAKGHGSNPRGSHQQGVEQIGAPIIRSFVDGNHTRSYDSAFLDLQNGTLVPKDGVVRQLSTIVDRSSADVMFRGVSAKEYESIQRTGQIASSGAGNAGEGERGLTFYATDPDYASYYVHADSSMAEPGYVIAVKKPDGARIMKMADGGQGLGVSGALSAKDIVGAYRGRVIEQQQRRGLKVPTARKWHWEKAR